MLSPAARRGLWACCLSASIAAVVESLSYSERHGRPPTAVPTQYPTAVPTQYPTGKPTVPPPTPVAWTEPECAEIIKLVQEKCADMRGAGGYCVQPCEERIVKTNSLIALGKLGCSDKKNGWKAYMVKEWCWGGERLIVSKKKGAHWVGNCEPVMDFYCAQYKGQVLTGKDRDGEPIKVDACNVCVNHQFWQHIQNFGCWMSLLRGRKYCGKQPKGVQRYYHGLNKFNSPWNGKWLKTHPTQLEAKTYWLKRNVNKMAALSRTSNTTAPNAAHLNASNVAAKRATIAAAKQQHATAVANATARVATKLPSTAIVAEVEEVAEEVEEAAVKHWVLVTSALTGIAITALLLLWCDSGGGPSAEDVERAAREQAVTGKEGGSAGGSSTRGYQQVVE